MQTVLTMVPTGLYQTSRSCTQRMTSLMQSLCEEALQGHVPLILESLSIAEDVKVKKMAPSWGKPMPENAFSMSSRLLECPTVREKFMRSNSEGTVLSVGKNKLFILDINSSHGSCIRIVLDLGKENQNMVNKLLHLIFIPKPNRTLVCQHRIPDP